MLTTINVPKYRQTEAFFTEDECLDLVRMSQRVWKVLGWPTFTEVACCYGLYQWVSEIINREDKQELSYLLECAASKFFDHGIFFGHRAVIVPKFKLAALLLQNEANPHGFGLMSVDFGNEPRMRKIFLAPSLGKLIQQGKYLGMKTTPSLADVIEPVQSMIKHGADLNQRFLLCKPIMRIHETRIGRLRWETAGKGHLAVLFETSSAIELEYYLSNNLDSAAASAWLLGFGPIRKKGPGIRLLLFFQREKWWTFQPDRKPVYMEPPEVKKFCEEVTRHLMCWRECNVKDSETFLGQNPPEGLTRVEDPIQWLKDQGYNFLDESDVADITPERTFEEMVQIYARLNGPKKYLTCPQQT